MPPGEDRRDLFLRDIVIGLKPRQRLPRCDLGASLFYALGKVAAVQMTEDIDELVLMLDEISADPDLVRLLANE
jgi:hypothetical protein